MTLLLLKVQLYDKITLLLEIREAYLFSAYFRQFKATHLIH